MDNSRRSGQLFYHLCSPDVAKAAIAALRPQSSRSFTEVIGEPAWRRIPASYVVATEDRAISPICQRTMAAKVDTVHEMVADHSPFLSLESLTATVAKAKADGSVARAVARICGCDLICVDDIGMQTRTASRKPSQEKESNPSPDDKTAIPRMLPGSSNSGHHGHVIGISNRLKRYSLGFR